MILLAAVLLVVLLRTCSLLAMKDASEIVRPRVCQHPLTLPFNVNLCSYFLKRGLGEWWRCGVTWGTVFKLDVLPPQF